VRERAESVPAGTVPCVEVPVTRVLVLLGLGPDVAVAPQLDMRSGRVREDWSVHDLDPASGAALDLALELKDLYPQVQVTAVHLGPRAAEVWLRRALAWGCDRAVRVWYGQESETAGAEGAGDADGLGLVTAAGKAVILAAAVEACGFDLVLTGARGVVEGSGQLGLRLAAELGVPCVTGAVALKVEEGCDGRTVEVRRRLEQGFEERIEAIFPLVVTVAPGDGLSGLSSRVPSAATLLAAHTADIPVWTLADLGVPEAKVRRAEGQLVWGPPRARRPRLIPLPAPDQSLPAFDRILRLIEGSVRHREGRVVRLPADKVADEVFCTLKEEGWLDHLLVEARAPTATDGERPQESQRLGGQQAPPSGGGRA